MMANAIEERPVSTRLESLQFNKMMPLMPPAFERDRALSGANEVEAPFKGHQPTLYGDVNRECCLIGKMVGGQSHKCACRM